MKERIPKVYAGRKPNKAWIALAFGMLIAFIVACGKDSVPEPAPSPEPTPTDTVPHVPNDTIPPVPNDTIVPTPGDTITPGPGGDTIQPTGGKVVYFYYEGGYAFPQMDSIRHYAADPTYDTVYIRWCPYGQDYWTPIGFHIARDSLQKRFDLSPKVCGAWWVIPYQILPDADSTNIHTKGMIRSDSTQFANWHYTILPIVGGKNNKPVQSNCYNGS